jgi:hypothetical protein
MYQYPQQAGSGNFLQALQRKQQRQRAPKASPQMGGLQQTQWNAQQAEQQRQTQQPMRQAPAPGAAPAAPAGTYKPAAPNPWAQWGMDPTQQQQAGQAGSKDQAVSGLKYAAQQQLGRELTEKELNDAANSSGYGGSGNVTGEQYNKALAFISSLKPPTEQSPLPPGGIPYGASPAMAPNTLEAGLGLDPRSALAQLEAEGYDAAEDDIGTLVAQLLQNPETLNPQAVSQMKVRAKEAALAQAQQLRGQASNDLAARGFDPAGGVSQAVGGELDMGLIDSLINSNRDIDLAATAQKRQDVLGALAAAEGMLGGQVSRAGALSGDAAQWAGIDYGKSKDDRMMLLQEFLGKSGVDLDTQRLAEQKSQFKTATGLDLARFLESVRQFDVGFGENQRQFNNNSALNWTNVNNAQQNNLLRYLESLNF